jgi:SET domain-containing protein
MDKFYANKKYSGSGCTSFMIKYLCWMTIPDKDLYVAKSKIPAAGKGLFTKVFIPKGTLITEYVGQIQTWKEVKEEVDNDYIYYINSKHVINARPVMDALARYANDGEGREKIRGISNNSKYMRKGMRVFIKAIKDIAEGEEILVSYGTEYWEQDIVNRELQKTKKK